MTCTLLHTRCTHTQLVYRVIGTTKIFSEPYATTPKLITPVLWLTTRIFMKNALRRRERNLFIVSLCAPLTSQWEKKKKRSRARVGIVQEHFHSSARDQRDRHKRIKGAIFKKNASIVVRKYTQHLQRSPLRLEKFKKKDRLLAGVARDYMEALVIYLFILLEREWMRGIFNYGACVSRESNNY